MKRVLDSIILFCFFACKNGGKHEPLEEEPGKFNQVLADRIKN